MSLYEIIKALQNASGSNAKLAILQEHKDNKPLQDYMWLVYDPAINFYQSKLPAIAGAGQWDFGYPEQEDLYNNLAERKITGNKAKEYLEGMVKLLNIEGQELLSYVIKRSIGASVGDTMVLKTWPDLYFTVPYQRCSLLDKKAKERFAKLPLMYVQPKLDGSFLYLVKEEGKEPQAITRAGSKYPEWFAEYLAERLPDNSVLIGECLVYEDGVMLNRQTGNGQLNSILKGGESSDSLSFEMTAWDVITVDEFKMGKCPRTYIDRLTQLQYLIEFEKPPEIKCINNYVVKTLEDAYKIYSEHTAHGEEGCVLKCPDSLWKDGTSKDCVKMKVEFEVDLEITDVVEGSGKASGMMGAVSVKSREGIIQSDVGTGWTDEARKYIWSIRDTLKGKILAVKANDIISKRGSDTKSLFLPVAIEVRFDKTQADTYEECVAILNVAKGLK